MIERTRSRALELVDLLFEAPIVTARLVAGRLSITDQGAMNLIARLEGQGILRFSFAFRKRKFWEAHEVLALISGS